MRGASIGWLVAASACLSKPTLPNGGVDANGDAAPWTANYAFVTKGTRVLNMTTDFSEIDTFCTTSAHDAGLPGSYVAWLSNNETGRDAFTLVGNHRGWIRPGDQLPVADVRDELALGNLFYPVRLDEDGHDVVLTGVPPFYVATGTDENGSGVPGVDCSTGVISLGSPDAEGRAWTDDGREIDCSTAAHFYCFGIDKNVPVAPTIDPTHRRAFLSKSVFAVATGLADADATCQMNATNEGLPGTSYKALLATQSASAASRFVAGAPWMRLDGVVVTADLGAFGAPLDFVANGNRARDFVWSGAPDLSSAAGAGGACVDWTMAGAPLPTYLGDSARSTGGAFGAAASNNSCSTPRRLYCFQE